MVAWVGFAGEQELHRPLLVVNNGCQPVQVAEDQRAALVGGEAAGEADRQGFRVQDFFGGLDFRARGPEPFQARLTVRIPLWGNFQQPLEVSQAKDQQQNLQESVRARGLQLQTDVNGAFLTLQTTYQTIAIQDTNRTAAREQLQLATERYRVGSGTFFELLDAQVAALRAETDYVNAVYDYHKALAALEAAVGRPLR